jgi:hypothetical protein
MALGLVGLAAPPALADTTTYHDVTYTFHSAIPCVGAATIRVDVNAVVRRESTPNGGYHESDNTTGAFTATYDAGGTASGHFDISGEFNSGNGTTGEGSNLFNGHVINGVGAGTSWHSNFHINGPLDPTQLPKVAFGNFHCG